MTTSGAWFRLVLLLAGWMAPAPAAARAGPLPDTVALYGTWRWVGESGTPASGVPSRSGNETYLLRFDRNGTYECYGAVGFPYYLCGGAFNSKVTTGRLPGGNAATLDLHVERWFQGVSTELLAAFQSPDTLLVSSCDSTATLPAGAVAIYARDTGLPRLTGCVGRAARVFAGTVAEAHGEHARNTIVTRALFRDLVWLKGGHDEDSTIVTVLGGVADGQELVSTIQAHLRIGRRYVVCAYRERPDVTDAIVDIVSCYWQVIPGPPIGGRTGGLIAIDPRDLADRVPVAGLPTESELLGVLRDLIGAEPNSEAPK